VDVFFTRIPWNFQLLPLVTWGYYHQGDLHTFSTGGRSWFVVRKKIRAQTVWENHRWIRQRCHKQIRHVFLQKRWWHWYLMLRLFQAIPRQLFFISFLFFIGLVAFKYTLLLEKYTVAVFECQGERHREICVRNNSRPGIWDESVWRLFYRRKLWNASRLLMAEIRLTSWGW